MSSQFLQRLSSKATELGKYIVKERIIPPQNIQRYIIGGFLSYHVYNELDTLSKSCVGETNYKNVNFMTAASVGVTAWYAPYVMGSLYVYHNYTKYADFLHEKQQ